MLTRLSKLTGTDVNLFLRGKFSSGTNPRYETLNKQLFDKLEGGREGKENMGASALIGNQNLGNKSYVEGVLPIFGGGKWIGTLSLLRSKEIAQRNTIQTIELLVVVSLVCILVVFPFTLLSARSVARPIKMVLGDLESVSQQVEMLPPDRFLMQVNRWLRVRRIKPPPFRRPHPPLNRCPQ